MKNSDTYVVKRHPDFPDLPGPALANPYVHAIRLRPYDVRTVEQPRAEASSSSDAPPPPPPAASTRGRRRTPPPPPPVAPTALTALDGPNAGSVFTPGMWLRLRRSFFSGLLPGSGLGVRRDDMLKAVVR